MGLRLTTHDRQLLADLADHRALSLGQLIALRHGNAQAMRRRVRALEAADLILATSISTRFGRGRPEKIVSVTDTGAEVLRRDGTLGQHVGNDHITAAGIAHMGHELLVNWFRVHLSHARRLIPGLSVQFLAAQSPFCLRDGDRLPLTADHVAVDQRKGRTVGFIPDGVFCLVHDGLNKALLFFLEVDMGTMTLTGGTGGGMAGQGDVRQKITNYQAYFRSGGYRRYDSHWHRRFRGFRLLLLTHSAARLRALCRLVRALPPSDFVWLTDQDQLARRGAWSRIWARGGQEDRPLESILGSQTPDPCPAPPFAHGI